MRWWGSWVRGLVRRLSGMMRLRGLLIIIEDGIIGGWVWWLFCCFLCARMEI